MLGLTVFWPVQVQGEPLSWRDRRKVSEESIQCSPLASIHVHPYIHEYMHPSHSTPTYKHTHNKVLKIKVKWYFVLYKYLLKVIFLEASA